MKCNHMILLTEGEKKRFQQWIVENVTTDILPGDEGNEEALLYNLLHLLTGDGDKYSYSPGQDEEIERLRRGGVDLR